MQIKWFKSILSVAVIASLSGLSSIRAFACDPPTIVTNYCLGAGNVGLTASAAASYNWNNGSDAQSITVDQAGIYTVTVTDGAGCTSSAAINIGNELVVNGDFNGGNAGFSSEYGYSSDLYPEGLYYVTTDAGFTHGDFYGVDHTNPGSGNFMVVNGSGNPNTLVWGENIAVVPNTTYYFSTWVTNVDGGSPALLQFSINGMQLGDIFAVPDPNFVWTRFYISWFSGSNTTADIRIINQNTELGGNDFGLDDISFSTLSPVSGPSIFCNENVTVNAAAGSCSAEVTLTAPLVSDNCAGGVDPNATPELDQTSPDWGTIWQGMTSYWQSFTAGSNGVLTSVGVEGWWSNTTTGYTLNIYESTGTGGTLIHSEPVTFVHNGMGNLTYFTLSSNVNLTAGAVYTWNMTNTVGFDMIGYPWASYAGGIGSQTQDQPGWEGMDFHFETYMIASATTLEATNNHPSTTYPVGTTDVIWTVTDSDGNTATCTQQVTVLDAEAPSITCPGNINASVNASGCTAVVNYTVNYSDNCSTPTIQQTAGLSSGSPFPKGTTTNTFVVTDAAGNTSTCSFNVTVTDNQAPTIACPGTIYATVNATGCKATVTYNVTYNDNCPGATLQQTTGFASGSAFPKGTTTNTFVVTDASGNTATCSFNVVVTTTLAVNAGIDEQTYYGYSGDQTVSHTAVASGGTPPYTYAWSLSRPLLCNQVNSAGDEAFSAGTCTFNTCPSAGSPSTAPSCSGNATVTTTLAEDADVCVTVTDSKGCSYTDCFHIYSEDARCFAGNSTINKVKVCHKTGSASNPWVQICVAQPAVPTHLAENHSDYLGTCGARLDEESTVSQGSGEFTMYVYPNPANSNVNVEFETSSPESYMLSMYDVTGKLVSVNQGVSFEEGNRITTPVAHLANGMYMIRLTVGDKTSSVRLVVSK